MKYIPYILIIILTLVLVKTCNDKPEIITETEYITKTDTIHTTEIVEKPILKYVETIKTVKGNDSIIYVEKPTETSIEANEYKATVKTDSSRADLKILTTGKLLDVKGIITYDKEIVTKTITKSKSGLFLGVQSDIDFKQYGLTLDYQLKNTIMLGTSINYNQQLNNANVMFKVAIKL